MGLVIVKDQDFVVMQPVRDAQNVSRLSRLYSRWLNTRNNLRKGWERFAQLSGGRRVPYRVWSRHGAYLELNRTQQRH